MSVISLEITFASGVHEGFHAPWAVIVSPVWWLGLMTAVILLLLYKIRAMKSRASEYEELVRRYARREQTHERRYRELLDHSSDIVYTHSLDGKLITWSKAGELITGYTQRELFQTNIADLAPPDRRPEFRELLRQMSEGCGAATFEFVVLAKDGSRVTLDVSTRPITQEGNQIGVLGFARDVTARRRTEEALRNSELRLRTVVSNAPLILFAFDAAGVLTFCEGKGLAGWGLDPATLTGRSVRELESTLPVLSAAHAGAASGEVVTMIQEAGGMVYESRLVPVEGPGGRPAGLIGVAFEITERKKSEEEAHRARQAAEAASRAKSEFLANMSHEIRTPMNSILGMTELTLETALNADQREYLELVKTSAHSLLAIINDVLDFSKVEAGKLELDLAPFNVKELVESTVKSFAFRARQKRLQLTLDVAPAAGGLFLGDAGRLRQVLTNLIGNAIKFTDAGSISVTVSPELQTQSEAMLRFEVKDTGVGIPADKQRVIFEAFAQADGSATRKYGGTGLGLTISRQMVELMQGKIGVDSAPGAGSAFHFTVRLAKIVQQMARIDAPPARSRVHFARGAEHGKPAHPPLRILVVEDNPANQKLVCYILQKQGYTVELANNGREALEVLERSGPAGVDLVLMDLQMPGMDGLSATGVIREKEKKSGDHTPIVALTAHAMKGDFDRCLAAGMDGYISKPIQRDQLLQAIERFARKSGHEDGADRRFPLPVEVFDMAQSLDRAGGDVDLLLELAQIFLQISPRHLEEAARAISVGDMTALGNAVHALKSSMGNFAAKAAFQAAILVQQKIGEGDLRQIEEAYELLRIEAGRLTEALEEVLEGSGAGMVPLSTDKKSPVFACNG
jgi:PAS domain S-box-containing protein